MTTTTSIACSCVQLPLRSQKEKEQHLGVSCQQPPAADAGIKICRTIHLSHSSICATSVLTVADAAVVLTFAFIPPSRLSFCLHR